MSNNSKMTRANLFEALAIVDGRNATDWPNYHRRWGSDCLYLKDEPRFAQEFGYKLQIWRLDRASEHNCGVRIFGNTAEKILPLLVDANWDIGSERLHLNDKTCLIHDLSVLNYYLCEYPECAFVTHREERLTMHHNAHRADRITCAQTVMGEDVFLVDRMKSEGVLPHDFREEWALFWDIECLLVPIEGGHRHVPVSIGATKNFGTREYFEYRSSMEPSSLKTMVDNFIDFLELSHAEYLATLPERIMANKITLLTILKRHREGIATLFRVQICLSLNFYKKCFKIQFVPFS